VLTVLALTAGAASPSAEDGGVRTAVPPATATGSGPVARVDGVVASVEGVVAEIVPRTGSEDGALEQEGEATFTLSGDVYFDSGSAVLVPRATADLAAVAAQVREAGVTALQVVGHTDTVGSDASNQVLSEDRAASVVAALQPQLPGVTLSAEGRGERELVASETTEDGQDDPAGRALNRRVTITPAG
jgi:outer membrane protein OmpA-like peptidoglycan-associated protein